MPTREEAIAAAAQAFAEGRKLRDSLPVKEAARRAYTPTGPSLEELERRIAARRASVPTRDEAIEAAGEVYGAILANPERRDQLRQARAAKAAERAPADDSA